MRQCQCCNNSAMTLQNRVCNPFSSVSIDFNENRIASVIAELVLIVTEISNIVVN